MILRKFFDCNSRDNAGGVEDVVVTSDWLLSWVAMIFIFFMYVSLYPPREDRFVAFMTLVSITFRHACLEARISQCKFTIRVL